MAIAATIYDPPAGGVTVIAVPYAASVTLNMALAEEPEFQIGQLTGNIAVTFINGRNGQKARVVIKQDAASARTVTWDSAVCSGSEDLALPALSTTLAKENLFGVNVLTRLAKPYWISASNRGATA